MSSFGIAKLSLYLSVVLMVLGGCVRDGLGDCPPEPEPTVDFLVKAYTDDGIEISGDEVRDVTLYVFDSEMRFIQRIDTQIGSLVKITPPKDGRFNIVAWGNLRGGKESMPNPAAGDLKSTVLVSLLSNPNAPMEAYNPVDDLFYGEVFLTESDLNKTITIPIRRKAGSMNVTINKLKEFSGYTDDDFSVVVRETYDAIDFDGKYTGSMASYYLKGSFDANGVFSVPSFNIIPGKALVIDIYHGHDLIYTINTTADGLPIDVAAGKLTNVLINFDTGQGLIHVSVNVTEWGRKTIWKDY